MTTFDNRLVGFAAERHLGILTTLKRDGRPQQSPVSYTLDPETRVVRVSVTDDRAKIRNIRRDSRVSLFVLSEDGWSYAVLEGDAELSAVATDPQDATVEALIEAYRVINGTEHPDWDDYRRAMVDDRRVLLTLRVTHLYGAPPAS